MLQVAVNRPHADHRASEPHQGHLRLLVCPRGRNRPGVGMPARSFRWQHPLIGGLVGGQVVHLSGSSAQARDALAVGLAVRACRAGGVLYITDAQRTDQVIESALAVDSGTGLQYVRCVLSAAKFGISNQNRIFSTCVSRNLFVCPSDQGGEEDVLRRQARRLARHRGLAAVVVDTLAPVSAQDTKAWQLLAHELGCVVVRVAEPRMADAAVSHQLHLDRIAKRRGQYCLLHQSAHSAIIRTRVSLSASSLRFRRLPVAVRS